MELNKVLSWKELDKFAIKDGDRVNGLNNSYTNLRLFYKNKTDAKLIFYRDRHAWCPYCQKIWLWLEFKKVPYKIEKINMYCYGEKEKWYLKKIPSGKLPAIELNGQIISESDNIIDFLEKEYGTLGSSIYSNKLAKIRTIERNIFRSWCEWLCRNNFFDFDNSFKKNNMIKNLEDLENLLNNSSSGFIDPVYLSQNKAQPGIGDIIFIPYLERINASLFYYKGYKLRIEFPLIHKWLTLLESESTYTGSQGDFHTHSHDLPPQMGGCFKDINEAQQKFSKLIDSGEGAGKLEINKEYDSDYYAKVALTRVIKHKNNIINVNPCENNSFDFALRSALTYLIHNELNKPDKHSYIGLRYLRDRISVPRDMPLISARLLRKSLEKVASIGNSSDIYKIPTKHRYDQNPNNFILRGK
tara:strand:- start:81 stop:1322 length:1242 start_codon:yes stop_codon:yes gene_type:complete